MGFSLKKWWKSITVGGSMGLIAMGAGLIGFSISGDDLSYLVNTVPAFLTAGIALFVRFTEHVKGLGAGGLLALAIGLIGGGANVLPGDLIVDWQSFQNMWIGIFQIVLTLLTSYGIYRKDTKLVS